MSTLVLSPRYNGDADILWRTALESGWNVVQVRSYGDAVQLAGKELAYYGEASMADLIAPLLGVALLQPSDDWLPRLPAEYRLREIELTTIGAARHWPRLAFIKPCGEKVFPAAVYERGLQIDGAVQDDISVLAAEPVMFGMEVRSFIVNRRVATISAYIRDGQLARRAGGVWPLSPGDEAAAMRFFERILADPAVELPPGLVLDCGEIKGRGWAVVEANPAWTSGLCGCNPQAVLEVLRATCISRSALPQRYTRWVFARNVQKLDLHDHAPP